ncbi:hypothetical protein [Streptomyces chrestomyceticus]|uniref:hypothetical protein n=1 Tax=Streptomyces chrestomyceticus TaxID=68185 RepID=UPI0037A8E3FC
MLIMDAVMETYDTVDFARWPAAAPSEGRLLVLSGEMSLRQVGTAMAVLTSGHEDDASGHGDDNEAPAPAAGAEAVAVARHLEHLLSLDLATAPGGIRLKDTTTGTVISPGCCFGLENWHDWYDLLNGDDLWLGHDPTARIEHEGPLVRIWPDTEASASGPIELPLAELPALLRTVHDNIKGFLTLVEQWVHGYAPALAPAVIAKLHEDWCGYARTQ